jgi:hypothetical protein
MPEDKVICPLCKSEVIKEKFRFHFQVEKYVLDVIAKNNPDWKEADGGCQKCMDYYMELGEQ